MSAPREQCWIVRGREADPDWSRLELQVRPQKAAKDGVAVFSTSVQVYLQSDSKAATLALKVLGPTAPKLAEQGAEQFLEFFNGIADYVQKHPSKADALLAPGK